MTKYKTGTKIKILTKSYRWNKRPIANLRQIWSNVECAYRRGRYGWSYQDVWGLDHHLSTVIRDSINWWLVEANGGRGPQGYPVSPRSSVQVLDPEGKEYDEWKETLAAIADGFSAANKIIDLDYDYRDPNARDELMGTMENGLTLFRDHFLELWD